MKKKIIVGCIGIVLMFLVMSVASAALQKTNFEKAKASPLFKIRIQNEIQEKNSELKTKVHDIFINFIENRIFFIIPSKLKYVYGEDNTGMTECPTMPMCTCAWKTLCCAHQNNQGNYGVLNTRGGVCTYNKWCWDLS